METAQQHIAAVPPPGTREETETWIPAPKVAGALGITRRTLGRWLCDEKLNFPRPTVLKRQLYFAQREIERWKLERALLSIGEAA